MGKYAQKLQALFSEWQGGQEENLESYLSILSENVEYDSFLHPTKAQEAGIFYLTKKKGKHAVREMHKKLQSQAGMSFERYNIMRWYESDDTVFLLVDIKARVHDTGKVYEDQHLLEYVFNEKGQVCKFRHWLDTAKHIEVNTKDYIDT